MSDLPNDTSISNTSNVVPLMSKRVVANMQQIEIDPDVLTALQIQMKQSVKRLGGPSVKEIDLYADDLRSVESESYFKQRFGFALGRRGRIAVIEVMDEYDFSSAEIKALYFVGSLSWDVTNCGLDTSSGSGCWVRRKSLSWPCSFYSFLLAWH